MAVVVVQNQPVWPYTMRDNKGEAASGGLAVPVVMCSKEDGERLKQFAAESSEAEGAPAGVGEGERGGWSARLLCHKEEAMCPICQEEYETGAAVLRMPCRHLFCKGW